MKRVHELANKPKETYRPEQVLIYCPFRDKRELRRYREILHDYFNDFAEDMEFRFRSNWYDVVGKYPLLHIKVEIPDHYHSIICQKMILDKIKLEWGNLIVNDDTAHEFVCRYEHNSNKFTQQLIDIKFSHALDMTSPSSFQKIKFDDLVFVEIPNSNYPNKLDLKMILREIHKQDGIIVFGNNILNQYEDNLINSGLDLNNLNLILARLLGNGIMKDK